MKLAPAQSLFSFIATFIAAADDIKLFYASLTHQTNKLERLSSVNFFQHSLIFEGEGKAGNLQLNLSTLKCSTWVQSGLSYKY